MDSDKLNQLRIEPGVKTRPRNSVRLIFVLVLLALIAAALLAFFSKDSRIKTDAGVVPVANAGEQVSTNTASAVKSVTKSGDVVLTASGYIINRERIEISPRFTGVVKWIGVHKGDIVTNGQIVVRLDDAEYQAQLTQAKGKLVAAQANVIKAELTYQRITNLTQSNVETKQNEDDTRLELEAVRAAEREAEGSVALIMTYIDWTVIRAPLDGVVLEKLASAGELVTPQSFGGLRGPSTALLAVADLKDLQVEIDVNESDLSKISRDQKCRVSPEAYPDKHYEGIVAEVAPEADRQKGTLQIKVQILGPDEFLTPELSAKVDFLAR